MKLMIITTTTTVRFAHTTASFLNIKPTTSTTIARFARTTASSLIIITIEMLNMVL